MKTYIITREDIVSELECLVHLGYISQNTIIYNAAIKAKRALKYQLQMRQRRNQLNAFFSAISQLRHTHQVIKNALISDETMHLE